MAHTLDADRLRRHQRHDSNHISMLETASMAGDGGGTTTDDDEDAVSLAYLSQNSPSDVGSSSNYYPQAAASVEYYDSEDRPTTRLAHGSIFNGSGVARAHHHRRRSSLSSLRYSGGQHQQQGTDGYALLFTREYAGLVANFAAIGAVHGVFQSVVYPFFKIYLNMDEYEAFSAEKWLALPWLAKFLLAFASDAFFGPTTSNKKKLALYVGWVWCLLFALIVILVPSPEPYAKSHVVVNENAPAAGGKFAALLTLAAFGYVFVDAVCDGLMVQLAHQGPSAPAPPHKNGPDNEELHQLRQQSNAHVLAVVTTLQASKFCAQMATTFIIALLCNSKSYGGSFAWSPALRGVFALVLVLGSMAVAATWFFLDLHEAHDSNLDQYQYEVSEAGEVDDDEHGETASVLDQLRATAASLWRFTRMRDVWQVVLFTFVTRVGFTYYASSAKALYTYWLDVSPLMSGVFSSIHFGIFAVVALALHKWHLLSPKRVMALATAGAIFTTLLSALFTVFNVLRSAVLTLAFEQITSAFEALAYFVALFAAVHVCGRSGALASSQFSLVLAVGNLGVPFAVSLSQSVGAHLDVFDTEYESDTKHARAQVMYCFVIPCVVKLLCLAALPLLPAQQPSKNDLRARTQTTRTSDLWRQEHEQEQEVAQVAGRTLSKWPPLVVAGGVGLLLLWATLMALLASFETTACLTVAGGEGC
ncbi:hypothetical protein Gpo141_00004597 [Globisporangium polare]